MTWFQHEDFQDDEQMEMGSGCDAGEEALDACSPPSYVVDLERA